MEVLGATCGSWGDADQPDESTEQVCSAWFLPRRPNKNSLYPLWMAHDASLAVPFGRCAVVEKRACEEYKHRQSGSFRERRGAPEIWAVERVSLPISPAEAEARCAALLADEMTSLSEEAVALSASNSILELGALVRGIPFHGS